jgi:hypothetical protein
VSASRASRRSARRSPTPHSPPPAGATACCPSRRRDTVRRRVTPMRRLRTLAPSCRNGEVRPKPVLWNVRTSALRDPKPAFLKDRVRISAPRTARHEESRSRRCRPIISRARADSDTRR